jgi:hypothetical protein
MKKGQTKTAEKDEEGGFEKLTNRIEVLLEDWLDQFQKKPISSSIKVLLIFFVIKTIYNSVRR